MTNFWNKFVNYIDIFTENSDMAQIAYNKDNYTLKVLSKRIKCLR